MATTLVINKEIPHRHTVNSPSVRMQKSTQYRETKKLSAFDYARHRKAFHKKIQ